MYELKFPTSDEATADAVSDLLLAFLEPDTSAASTIERDGRWYVEAYYNEAPDTRSLTAQLSRAGHKVDVSAMDLTQLAPTDWIKKSLEGLPPVRAERFLVHGRHDRAYLRSSDIGIEIEAGLAFGTGHHGTTRGCLLAMSRLLRRTTPRTVLDMGTGTGVLANAAAKATRGRVVGIDADPVAVTVARDNARRNGVAAFVALDVASNPEHPSVRNTGPYDLAIANILAPPLIAMATGLSRSVRPGGHLILSGLLMHQSRDVEAAYVNRAMALCERHTLGDWRTLVFQRR